MLSYFATFRTRVAEREISLLASPTQAEIDALAALAVRVDCRATGITDHDAEVSEISLVW